MERQVRFDIQRAARAAKVTTFFFNERKAMKKLLMLVGIIALPMLGAFGVDGQTKKAGPPIVHQEGKAQAGFKKGGEFKRGLKKSTRHVLASAKRFVAGAAALPVQVIVLPKQLSMWGNDQYGDCVSASEAARKAAYSIFCGLPETFIPEANVISWAQTHGYLNGANLTDVMTTMMTDGMVAADGKTYLDGPYLAVDYSKPSALQAALAMGPVNLGIDANALPGGAGNGQGWCAFGGFPQQFQNEDHCVPLLGYGPTTALFAAFSDAYGVTVTPPAGAPANGYLIFTWSTVGIVDDAWIMSTVGEAWSQNPTTVGQSPPNPVPPGPTPTPTPTPPPSPTPPPGPAPQTFTVTIPAGIPVSVNGALGRTYSGSTTAPVTVTGTITNRPGK